MIKINETRYKSELIRGNDFKRRERVETQREAGWRITSDVSLALHDIAVGGEMLGRRLDPVPGQQIMTGDDYVAEVRQAGSRVRKAELIYEEA